MKLEKGFDWLCKCGESNYEDHRDCTACEKLRMGNEANYRSEFFVNGNDLRTCELRNRQWHPNKETCGFCGLDRTRKD
jgi:ribosomal protein L37E